MIYLHFTYVSSDFFQFWQVTMYDVHRTFLSMCSVEGGVESSNGKQTMVPTRKFEARPDHGDGPYSFFHEEVPVGRTCHDALGPEIICECTREHQNNNATPK